MKTPNQVILEHLTSAPASQLSEPLRQEAMNLDPNDPAAIRAYFHKIYNSPAQARSDFVATLINPEFTDIPEYSVTK